MTTQTSVLSKLFSGLLPIALWFVLVIALLLVIGYIYQLRTTASDFEKVPPPGQRVDVGGYSLHIYCTGEGSGPTIVVDAGNGDFSVSWTAIQREVAKSARICTYDRAGYGWSDISPHPRTATQMSKELHQLLVNAKIEPPYILVGHSLGGMTIRVFADLYHNEVSGMVLVDAGHEDQLERLPPEYLKLYQQQQSYFSVLGFMSRFGILRLIGSSSKGDELAPPQVAKLPKDVQPVYMMMISHPAYFDTTLAELRMLSMISTEVSSTGPLGDIPLTILTADSIDEAAVKSIGLGDDFPAVKVQQAFNEMQNEFETLSTNSTHIVVKDSTHAIPLDQPDAVIKAILDTVTMAR